MSLDTSNQALFGRIVELEQAVTARDKVATIQSEQFGQLILFVEAQKTALEQLTKAVLQLQKENASSKPSILIPGRM